MSGNDKKAELDEAIAEAREVLRELHGVLKDIKQARRDVEQTWKMIHDDVDRKIENEIKAGLQEFDRALKDAIDVGTQKTYERFDKITDILLGEDSKSKKRRKETIAELAERAAERRRQREGES